METKLARIAERAKSQPGERFTSLMHLVNEEFLESSHRYLARNRAAGVDGLTKEEYGQNLKHNIEGLVERLKQKSYRPQPVKRVYIPKPGSDKKRPLGIPAYEDKLVQSALVRVLNCIYEQDFENLSFGFRPGRSAHDALKALNYVINKKNVNYVVDADIKGFFDHVDHEWLMKFLGHRIADPNILRLIRRFLKAGVMEQGIREESKEGTPQGGVISPLLANIYLHYVLDLWFMRIVRKHLKGKAYMVRYADDFVCCFEYEEDAGRFYKALKERLKKFNLEIAEEKSKIIRFSRTGLMSGEGEQGTFNFLGFTHYLGRNRQGAPRVKRKTNSNKFRGSLQRVKEWLKSRCSLRKTELMNELKRKIEGYYRYYGVTDNYYMLETFRRRVYRLLFIALNRRSQRRIYWDVFNRFVEWNPLPKPRIYVNIFDICGKLVLL
jgi:RNA-directed DNA polymerase